MFTCKSIATLRKKHPVGTLGLPVGSRFSAAAASACTSAGANRNSIVPDGHSILNGRVSKPQPRSTTCKEHLLQDHGGSTSTCFPVPLRSYISVLRKTCTVIPYNLHSSVISDGMVYYTFTLNQVGSRIQLFSGFRANSSGLTHQG